MTRRLFILALALLLAFAVCLSVACGSKEKAPENNDDDSDEVTQYCPRIASWLAKKGEIIASGKPYGLVMSAWFTSEEAAQIRSQSPEAKLPAGLSVNFIWENADWITFLETVASYGRTTPLEVQESMYLRKPNGERCPFGWASAEWGHEEIYAMDPRNADWVELITAFYKVVLDQSYHDGIIVDMVTEKPSYWFPEAISDGDWVQATKAIMIKLQEMNTEDKLVIFNAGAEYTDIDEYSDLMDGYVLENCLGSWGASYEHALEAAGGSHTVIYAVDTDDTGQQDAKRMRLGLTLSLLNDNTYFTYDFGSRDHGQAWWFNEYDVDLGEPLGEYYLKDSAYWREFEVAVVVSSPDVAVSVVLDGEYTDVTTGITSETFSIEAGDGRIYVKADGQE